MPNESTETVVRFGRDRIRGYYIFGALLLLIVVLNLAVGFWIEAGPSERHRSTIDILMAVLRQPRQGYVRRGAFFAVTMGLALFAAVKLFQAARASSRAFVAIGSEGVTLHLMRKTGPSSYALLPEQRFAWDAIHTVTYTARRRAVLRRRVSLARAVRRGCPDLVQHRDGFGADRIESPVPIV